MRFYTLFLLMTAFLLIIHTAFAPVQVKDDSLEKEKGVTEQFSQFLGMGFLFVTGLSILSMIVRCGKMLRIFFKYKRSLLSALCLCGKEALLKYFKAVTGRELTPAIIAVIQSFGSRINLHPHLHFLTTGGGEDKEGQFHKVSNFIEDEAPFVPSRGWAEMIKKVYEIDPLLYPHCGAEMKVIAFIEDHKIINKIIAHLKLTFMAERPPSPRVLQKELLMADEERGEYF